MLYFNLFQFTGEKPFLCPFNGCNLRFTLKHSLRTHYIRKHQNVRNKKIKCMWTNDVQDSVRSNENSSRILCEKEFDRVADLAKHVNEFHVDADVEPSRVCRWHGSVFVETWRSRFRYVCVW